MNKADIKRTLSQEGDFLTISQIAKILGVERHKASDFLYGLEYLPNGKAKLFLADDVANRIMELKEQMV